MIRAAFVFPLLLSGCSALSALDDATAVLDVYELRAPQVTTASRSRALTVTVEPPTTTGALDTERVLIKPSRLQAAYLPDARWGETVPVMVQSLMVRSLQATNGFNYVGREPLGLSGDVAIVTDVIDFQAITSGEGARIELALNVQLVREQDVRILRSRVFRADAIAPTTGTADLMTAFDAASNRLFADFAAWVVGAL